MDQSLGVEWFESVSFKSVVPKDHSYLFRILTVAMTH